MSHKPAAGGRQCACWRRLSVTLGFTGQLRDGTGLLFSHARSYDPALGRFTSADSIAPEREDPQTRNRYSDGRNNPLRYTDPSGHCGLLCIPAAVAAYFTAEVLAYVVATFVVVSFVTAVISCSQDAGCSAVLPEFADQLNQGAIGVREFLGEVQRGLAQSQANENFRRNLADVEANSEDWKVISAHTEDSDQGGISLQEVVENVKTGERIVRHTLLTPTGNTRGEPHYRPYYKNRKDE